MTILILRGLRRPPVCHYCYDNKYRRQFEEDPDSEERKMTANPKCMLDYFRGCLSGRSRPAWQALIGGVERVHRVKGMSELSISLLDPMEHDLGQLNGTRHNLCITARPPSSPGDRGRRPLPSSLDGHPLLKVECRPVAGGGATFDEEATAALIEDLAPKDMKYRFVFLLHYHGSDDALVGMVTALRERGLRSDDRSTSDWEEAERYGDGSCVTCGESSSHRQGERCLRLFL